MPPQTNKPLAPKRSSRRFITAVLLVGVVAAWLILGNRQAVYDWLRLYHYSPSPQVAQLATDDGLSAPARRMLYVNHPRIQDKAAFNQSCPNGGKEAAVLGCYIPNQRGIYVLAVDDPRLNGIEQVTAAHEMLHAAYDRLGSRDKQQVNALLMDYYQHGLTDQSVIDQMASYKKTEPNDLVNEMHSIFGTEITNLPPNLETYYQRYFTNRAAVAGFYTAYQAEFTSRKQAIAQYDARLANLKQQIQTDEADLHAKQAELASRQASLDRQRSSGNAAGYNAGVPTYNALVAAYNSEVQTVRSLVAQYNQLVAARNALALEEQQLVNDISSQVSPLGNQ